MRGRWSWWSKTKAAPDKAKEELFFRKTLEELGKSEPAKPKPCRRRPSPDTAFLA